MTEPIAIMILSNFSSLVSPFIISIFKVEEFTKLAVAAVTHQNADLAELLGELHAGCDDLFAAGLATHNFEQAHHVRRAEEMCTDYRFGPLGGRGYFVNAKG